jgi:hypothetical protein
MIMSVWKLSGNNGHDRLFYASMEHPEHCPKVSNFVHDKDGHATVILANLKWDLAECFDPNHVKKPSLRHFYAISKGQKKAW